MSGYIKTNWIDEITPLSSTNLNKIENELYKRSLLFSDSIQGTTQEPTYVNEDITKIEHKIGENIIRTDQFNYSQTETIETRTLNTGEIITLTYNFDIDGKYINTVVN